MDMGQSFEPTASSVVARLTDVRRRIDAVERPWTHPIEIVAVTKGFEGSVIEAACAAGCTVIGENYAQDLLSKRDVIERLQPVVHFIGQLQSNKVRQIADLISLWETIDRESIIHEVAKRAPGARVLVQVNATGETNKGGCHPDDVAGLIDVARGAQLVVEGLMAVGPTGRPPEAARPAFSTVRSLVDEHDLSICSMGMTADFEVAVAAGATHIRIGSALFGPRPPK